MIELKDPTANELAKELRMFRRGEGFPNIGRLAGLFYMTDILGHGVPERAFEEFTRLYEEFGDDPRSDVGAFFYLAGWTVGLDTVDERRYQYVEQFGTSLSSVLRHADQGLKKLVTIIRDRDEHHRPWALISIFQSGETFHPFLNFNMGYESWQPPVVHINGELVDLDFRVHKRDGSDDRYASHIVLPEYPLNNDVRYAETMGSVRVLWPMPVWPMWNIDARVSDPRIALGITTFRRRSVEVHLRWSRQSAGPSALS